MIYYYDQDVCHGVHALTENNLSVRISRIRLIKPVIFATLFHSSCCITEVTFSVLCTLDFSAILERLKHGACYCDLTGCRNTDSLFMFVISIF